MFDAPYIVIFIVTITQAQHKDLTATVRIIVRVEVLMYIMEAFRFQLCCPIPIDFDSPAPTSKPVRDLLLQLISLQKASGSWVLEAALAEVLGKTEEELAKPKPAPVGPQK